MGKNVLDKAWSSFKKENTKAKKIKSKEIKEKLLIDENVLTDREKESLRPAAQIILQTARLCVKHYGVDEAASGRPVAYHVYLISLWKDYGEKDGSAMEGNLTAAYVQARKNFVSKNGRDDGQYETRFVAQGPSGIIYELTEAQAKEQIVWEAQNLCDD